jgi:hypothetical protein
VTGACTPFRCVIGVLAELKFPLPLKRSAPRRPGKTFSKYGKYENHGFNYDDYGSYGKYFELFLLFLIHYGRHLTKVALGFFSGGAPIAPMQEYLGIEDLKQAVHASSCGCGTASIPV